MNQACIIIHVQAFVWKEVLSSLSLSFFFGWRTLTDMNTLEYIKWNRQLPNNMKAQSQYTWHARRCIGNLDWNKLYSNMLDTDFFFFLELQFIICLPNFAAIVFQIFYFK